MNLKIPSDVVVGQYLQLIALHIAAAIAAIYASGYVVGQAIHNTNNRLSTYTHDLHAILAQVSGGTSYTRPSDWTLNKVAVN